jgi:hypothetical protein
MTEKERIVGLVQSLIELMNSYPKDARFSRAHIVGRLNILLNDIREKENESKN